MMYRNRFTDEGRERIMLQAKNLSKSFHDGKYAKTILKDIHLHIPKGSWVTIMGPSGAGKTTLLNCLAGIIRPETGTVTINDVELLNLNEKQLCDFRRKHIGFIFQDFKLLPHYSVIDNVMLPLIYDEDNKKLKARAERLLSEVGIDEHLFHRLPAGLSGGEKQRVAIARSLIAGPDLLLCDEPTGNLNIESRNQMTDLLRKVKQRGQTIIVVTHDQEVANLGDVTYQLREGTLMEVG